MKKVFIFLIILVFGVFLHGLTMAQITDMDITLPDTLMPGMIESTGKYFEVTDSEYLNIVLDSSEAITLRLESVPEMVTMHIESASEAASTQITITGFSPSTTYYKYEDDYHNEVMFTTDENGSYSWTQDLSQLHFVFIQPRKSTKFIKDNSTGGDCTKIGTWNSTTKICTLIIDVNESIQIDNNYITLDGNGHTITGTGTGTGIHTVKRAYVTIKNLSVKNFSYGIIIHMGSYNNILNNNITSNNYGFSMSLSQYNTLNSNIVSNNSIGGIYTYDRSQSNIFTDNTISNTGWYAIRLQDYGNNTLTGNTASNNRYGIFIYVSSNNNTLTGNTASNNLAIGIWLVNGAFNNILTDNTVQENSDYDLHLSYFAAIECNNVIQNTIGSGGRPIKVFNNSPAILENETLAGLFLCNADYSNITNVTIKGSETFQNNGLFVNSTDYSNFTNINSSNNYYGIAFYNSNNNTLTGSTFSSNAQNGILLLGRGNNNILSNNTVLNNNREGIDLQYSGNTTIIGNSVSNNKWQGISLYSSTGILMNNTICNNSPNDFWCYWSSLTQSSDKCDKIFGHACTIISCTPCGADTIPPTTTVTLSGTLGSNDWYISDVQVTLTATDNEGGDGVKKTEYSFDNLIWNTYSSPFIISSEGTTTVYYKSTDNAGNIGTTKSVSLKIDKTSPATTTTVSGISGSNGWYISDVTIKLSATDTVSGVNAITYSINGQTTTVSGDRTSITLTADGKYDITYYAVDNAGNVEAQKSININIDRTVPTITTVTATPNTLWPPNHKMVDVLIDGSATDDMSGIASVGITVTDEYGIYNMTVPGFGSTIQLEAWREGTDKDERVYTITVVATDMAGNQSTATTQVTVPHDMGK